MITAERIKLPPQIGRVVIGILLLVGLFACQSELNEIKIGYLVDAQATDSKETIDAVLMAVEQENSRGRVSFDGKPAVIKVIVRECGPEASQAIDAARDLIIREQVQLIIGPNSSRAALPVSLIAEETRTPMISNGATHASLTQNNQYVFSTAVTDEQQISRLTEFLVNEQKKTRAGILYDTANVYSRSISQLFTDKFQALGGEVVANQSYLSGEKDFSEQVATIISTSADVVFLPNFSTDVQAQVKMLHAKSTQLTIAGTDSWNFEPHAQYSQDLNIYVPLMTHPTLFDNSTVSDQFVIRFQEKYGYRPRVGAALSYDTVQMALTALSMNSTFSAEQYIQALLSVKHKGVTGDIEFTEERKALRQILIYQQQGNAVSLVVRKNEN